MLFWVVVLVLWDKMLKTFSDPYIYKTENAYTSNGRWIKKHFSTMRKLPVKLLIILTSTEAIHQ